MPSKSQPTVVKIPSKKSRDTGIVRREVPSRPSAEGKEARPAPSPVAAPSGPPEAGGPYWTIQVVSGINPNKAEELRIALERQGYPNAVVKREGRYAAVRIGRFDSKDSPEALQFKKAISELKYEGRLQFQGCYFVKVE
jgi:cell division septation protein DedD